MSNWLLGSSIFVSSLSSSSSSSDDDESAMEQIENSSDEAIFFMGENPCWVSHLVDDMWSADRVLRSEEDELVLRSSQVSEPRMEPIP